MLACSWTVILCCGEVLDKLHTGGRFLLCRYFCLNAVVDPLLKCWRMNLVIDSVGSEVLAAVST